MEKYEDQDAHRRKEQDQVRNKKYGNSTLQAHSSSDPSQNLKPNTISEEILERNWKDMKPSYRKRFPNLTEEDVNYRTGEFDFMMERVAKRTGRNRQQVHQDIENWDSKNNPDWV